MHVLYLSCVSRCSSSRQFAVNYSCYVRREHSTATASAAGTVVHSACCCTAGHQCHTVETRQYNSPTNYVTIPISTHHTQWSAAHFGCCTDHFRSSVKPGISLSLLTVCANLDTFCYYMLPVTVLAVVGVSGYLLDSN